MRERGQYKPIESRRAPDVGMCFEHSLRLIQRYDNVSADAVQALLTALSRNGAATSIKPHVWEFEMARDGARVRMSWAPDLAGDLVVTIESRLPHAVDQTSVVRGRFEQILDEKIEPLLRRFGVTAVGAALEGPAAGQPDRVATIYVERKTSAITQVLGVMAVVGAVLWGRHQARQIEQLYKRIDLPQQSFMASLRQDAGSSLRSLANRVRPARHGRNS